MTQAAVEIVIVLALILLNGVFALSEIAVISARKTRLQQMVAEKRPGASTALDLAESPNRFLSTVQVGITLVGILAGAVGGSTLVEELEPLLAQVPLLAPYSETLSLGIVVLLITYLTVVLGELVPKRLALHSSVQIAMLVARPMQLLSIAATPVVRLLSLSTELVLRLFGLGAYTEDAVTEEEIRVMIEEGARTGMIAQEERDMVEGVFLLDDRPLESLMTPRTEIVWLDINDPAETHWQRMAETNHSRFPVCDGALDDVIGVVTARDLLGVCRQVEPPDLRALMHKPLFIPANMRARQSLERFRQTGRQMALLIDEYGGIEGLVTLFDILEAIVGDIPTQEELAAPPIVQREDGSWLVDGLLHVTDFKDYFDLRAIPSEGSYHTVGGFVIHNIGRIPRPGDHFQWADYRFEVMDMDGNRVDKVLVQLVEDETP